MKMDVKNKIDINSLDTTTFYYKKSYTEYQAIKVKIFNSSQ